ncbi:MAG: cytochrome P450 [Thermoleophilaceae bacterium]|nr:cytochrome P450 [Thermoleophilaceae bacterium]
MALTPPAPVSMNPLARLHADIMRERRRSEPLPPGEHEFSWARTRAMRTDPLRLLLDSYERYGPVFTLRLLHQPVVFAIGPEANHYITVSHAQNFLWRDGSFADLIALLGDGLLTIDGDYHRTSRKLMLPVFHRERIAAAAGTMVEETERALAGWEPGTEVDIYQWTRALAMRVAQRALFGFDPDASRHGFDEAEAFEQALSFYAADYALQIARGPRTPWTRMQRARRLLDGLIFGEIARRRASGRRGDDILSLLLDARDEEGNTLSDQAVRDQVMTLLFAGHDTTTSTVTFLFYELARHPQVLQRLLDEQDRVLGGRLPTAAELMGGEALPELEMALDETLRLYPPAWIGPRMNREAFELHGVRVPARSYVNYSSWVSHHLPEVFPEPEAFVPERFAPEAKAALPKGAYVPFGGGSRTCIGMRFGQLEIKTIATLVLQRFRLELRPGYTLRIRQMPTLSPIGGLPMRVRERALPGVLAGAADAAASPA